MKKVTQQNGFKFGWKSTTVKPTAMSDGFFGMRDWQSKAFDLLKYDPYMILNAPMGSGKSWLMCMLSAFKMKNDDRLRTIIAVPQTIIANGFAEANIILPDGEKLYWFAQHDLCSEQPSEGTINCVVKFLEGPHGFFADRVLLCSHATLVAVYKRLKEQERLNLLKDLILWIDEAHHVKNVEIEDFDGAVINNGIGELVSYLLTHNDNVQVGLATASFFRGDRCSLLTGEQEKKFKRFNLPYDEYLESMQYLRSFSFDFMLCGPDFSKGVEKLLKNRQGKDIIYIPHPQSKFSTGDKYREVEDILGKYKKVYGGREVDLENGLTVLRREDGELKVMDLVDEDRRQAKKDYIGVIKSKDDLDAIVALGMFKEGANWVWADRSIIVGARNSLVDIIQMVGRLFRDAKDKKHVEVIQLLPFSLDQVEDEEEFRENLNNYLKAIYASLILENILHPVKLKMPKDKEDGGGVMPMPSEDWLGEFLPDDAQQLSLIEEISNKLMEIVDTNKKAGDVTVLWDEYEKILPQILSDHGILDYHEEIGRQIWGMFARQTLRMQGIQVDDIPFDLLHKTNPLAFLLDYTSGVCDINTFRHLRTAINARTYMPFEELKAKIHEMRKNGQPLNNAAEYKVWVENGFNYAAVEQYRKTAA